MATTTTPAPESLQYRTEVKQLLDILAHSLYTDQEIFLRELISNASDALNRIQFETLTNQDVVDPDAELAIYLAVDEEANTLTIRDTGIGMNHDELIENLGTIAHSGAKDFLQQAKENQSRLEEIIGQFGVGFYSVFMVAQEVTVTSRSARVADQAWSWTSQGESSYTLTPAQKSDRGTEIRIQLKEDAAEFAKSWKIEQAVKKHSDYISFPIYLLEPPKESADDANEEEDAQEATTPPAPRTLNRRTAIWRQTPQEVQEEEYNDFYKQLTFDFQDPQLHIHLVTDAPVNMRALLYVPAHREGGMFAANKEPGLRLYSRKVLIQQRNKDLLPEYLRFVDGVVDSEDLPLNVSRETVQSNPLMRQMRRSLSNRITRELQQVADKDAETYAQFWLEFGMFLKEGVASDPASHKSLLPLLRFKSTKSGADEWVSLDTYKERMQEGQEHIYYVLGEDLKSVARSPHLDYFRANDLEVIYLVDPIDGFMTSSLQDVDGTSLQNVDDAGLKLPEKEKVDPEEQKEKLSPEQFDPLLARMEATLGDRISSVRESKQLVNNPCRLVSPENQFDRDLQRIRRMMEQDFEMPRKILEVNRNHPLVRNLAQLVMDQPDESLIDAAILQLFDNAQLLDGIHPSSADMAERMQLLMEAAVASRSAKPE